MGVPRRRRGADIGPAWAIVWRWGTVAVGGVEVAALGGGRTREMRGPAIVVAVVRAAATMLRGVGGPRGGDVIVCWFPLPTTPLRAGGPVTIAGGPVMVCFKWRRAAIAPGDNLAVFAGRRATTMMPLLLLSA